MVPGRRPRAVGAARDARAGPRDRGAAVAEFAMISVLLVFLFFAVLQVAVYFYVRNIVSASAAAGARHAAGRDEISGEGAQRASQLMSQGISAGLAKDITCTETTTQDAASGLVVAQVRCRGPLRVIFLPINLPLSIDVTAQALKEVAPQ